MTRRILYTISSDLLYVLHVMDYIKVSIVPWSEFMGPTAQISVLHDSRQRLQTVLRLKKHTHLIASSLVLRMHY
jgi:hypothetical protein